MVLCLAFCLQAADADSLSVRQRDYVFQDQKIEWLLRAHTELAKKERGIPGYRIQVYMDSGNQARVKTQRARAEFEQKYPDVNVYVSYDEPYFRLRVGDFRTRLDARRFMEQIAKDYPTGTVYVVVDTINFPDLDPEPIEAEEEEKE